MKLSNAQVGALNAMMDGEWYSLADLHAHGSVLTALHRLGYVNKRGRESLHLNHRTSILYAITDEGRVALDLHNGEQ